MDRRVVGVDIARFVALAGMMAIHILPAYDEGGVTFSQSLAGGRASALFALLAGVSMSLAVGGKPVDPRRWDAAAAGFAIRAVMIATLGLVLGAVDSRILVILAYYGLLFVIGLPLLLLPTRTLLIAASVWVVLGPALSHLLRPELPAPSGSSPTFDSLAHPLSLLAELLVTGTYPAFVWTSYLAVGLAVGRLPLRHWRTQLRLGVAGAGLVAAAFLISDRLVDRPDARAALAARYGGDEQALETALSGSLGGTTPTDTWWWLAVRSAHAGTPPDLAQTIGSALLVLAVCLAVGRALPRLGSVLFGAGAMTLTLYSLHVWLRGSGRWDADTIDVYVGQLVVVAAVGALFGLLRWKGPLEWGVAATTGPLIRQAGSR